MIQHRPAVAVSLLLACCVGCSDDQSEADGQLWTGDGPHAEGSVPPGDSWSGDLPPTSGTFPAGSGALSASLTIGGLERRVELYLPDGLAAAPPLLIVFHGTNGDAREMISGSYAQDLADAQGVIIAAPQARKMTKGDWDNHVAGDIYWETYPDTNPGTNPDLQLVQAIIAEAQRAYSVDQQRIYLLGHSSGGFFSILSGLTLRDRIAGFAANSAGLVRCDTVADCDFTGQGQSCEALASQPGFCDCSGAEKPVAIPAGGHLPAVYLTHSTDDTAVSSAYTCALYDRLQEQGYPLSLTLYADNGHSMPYNLALDSWAFLAEHPLP